MMTPASAARSGAPVLRRAFRGGLHVAMLLLASATACSDGQVAAPLPTQEEPLQLQVVSGQQQSGVAGEPLGQPLVVRVVRPNGAPVAGRAVDFVVTAGGGSTGGGTSISNAEGLAQQSWTLGPDTGTHQVEARLTDPATGRRVHAVSFTAQGTARSGGAAGNLARECDRPAPGWIWCDDFEQDRRSRYFEYDSAGGSFVRAASVGVEGSYAMRGRFAAAQVSAGSLKLAFGRTPGANFRPVGAETARYRDVYWRMYLRNEPGWSGGGGYKLSRATSLVNPSWAQAMIAHVWSGEPPNQNFLMLDPASGTDTQGHLRTTRYNDFNNLRWLGAKTGSTPMFGPDGVGKWRCVEARARLNDPGDANGVFQLWVDGKPEATIESLNWVGAYTEYGINAVFFENYWNGGSPRAQERYFDNIVVSTEPIGCAGSPPQPPPTGDPVGSVTVDPASASIAVDSTVQLSASIKDTGGRTVTDRAVTWSSSNPAVATVTGTGLVRGVAAGSATITASSEGKSGTAAIQVTVPSSSTSYNEPAGMTKITDRPFNSKARSNTDLGGSDCVGGSECWDRDEAAGRWTIVQDSAAPGSGDLVAQQLYARGFAGGSAPQGLAQKSWPMRLQYRTIYHRFWLKLSDNWYGHLTGGNKIFHIWAQPKNIIFYSAEGQRNGPLQFQIRLQGVPEPDLPAFRDNKPNVPGQTRTQIIRGKWHLFEVLMTLNAPGQKNGSFKVWQDGVLTHDYEGRELLGARVSPPYWWMVQWSPTWGGLGDTVPADMYMRLDQVYISGRK